MSVRYLLGFNRSDTDSMEVLSLIEECLWRLRDFRRGDVITSIDGTRIPDGKAYETYIEASPF